MNNACPDCGAVYAVTAKDIGRKIKCKKCGAALRVSEKGLVEDTGATVVPAGMVEDEPVAAAAPADDGDDFDTGDDEGLASRRGGKKGGGRRDRGPARERGPSNINIDINAILGKVGGIPTLLFGFGIFLVIWCTFMSRIADAAVMRAEAYPQKLSAEMQTRQLSLLPKGKASQTDLSPDELKKYLEDAAKIQVEYVPKQLEAQQDISSERISSLRSLYYYRYGTMFGFLFVAYGCMGYLLSSLPLTARIVAGVILGVMMVVVLISFGAGGDSPRSSSTMTDANNPFGGGVGPGAAGVGPGPGGGKKFGGGGP